MDIVKKETIIIAPHPDDEIIGCYSVLINKEISPIIIYTADVDNERRKEATNLKKFLPHIKAQLFQKEIPLALQNPFATIYTPDPSTEIHPEHRRIGAICETILRQGMDVIFYTTNMNVPYLYEVPTWRDKRNLLNKTYPSQKTLWSTDFRYFLFEGYCKWMRN